MSEARLAKARAGYEGYVYQPPKRSMALTLREFAEVLQAVQQAIDSGVPIFKTNG